eukprot:6992940-Karenia_brevis.AAC.1
MRQGYWVMGSIWALLVTGTTVISATACHYGRGNSSSMSGEIAKEHGYFQYAVNPSVPVTPPSF